MVSPVLHGRVLNCITEVQNEYQGAWRWQHDGKHLGGQVADPALANHGARGAHSVATTTAASRLDERCNQGRGQQLVNFVVYPESEAARGGASVEPDGAAEAAV